jgi:hypothetical protein
VVLDLVAWWPVWLLVIAMAWYARDRRLGMVKMAGLVPLLAFGVVMLFLAGHLRGWGLMPSASGRLIGPVATDYEDAALTAAIDGVVSVHGGAGFLYEALPLRWGGEVGVPEAFEEATEESIFVTLRSPADPGLQAFSGWEIRLSTLPSWELTLSGSVRADLSQVHLIDLDVSGSGEVTLGPVSRATEAAVVGGFIVHVPGDVPVRVVGDAAVPDDWQRLDDGWQSPTLGDGWVITAGPGTRVAITGP